jgi:hypothetical protein
MKGEVTTFLVEVRKMNKKIWMAGLALSFILLNVSTGMAQMKSGTHAPVITASYAVDRGLYGFPLRIYLAADDPEGDMLRIAIVADSLGGGHHPTEWVFLKPQYGKNFVGYLQWNTGGPAISEWTQVTLKISVMDKAGNESNGVVVPYTFSTSFLGPTSEPPAPFNQGDVPRLGYLDIQLIDYSIRQ